MSALSAVILAGGGSLRLGRDKAVLEVGGLTLAARVRRALSPLGAAVEIQGRPAGQGVFPVPAFPDTRKDAGPLGGMVDALVRAREAGQEGVVLAAVDLPRVVPPAVLELVRRWRALETPRKAMMVVRDARGRIPLLAVAGTEMAGPLADLVDGDGERAVHGAVRRLGDRVHFVHASELEALTGDPDLLLNLNTEEELDRLRRLPPSVPPLVSVAGWKDSGKTGVAVALVAALRRRGIRVAALKHGHGFRLDTPGTDSHRLRHDAGADPVILAGPEGFAAFGEWPGGAEPGPCALAARFCPGAELVVAEGWKSWPLPVVVVSREGSGDGIRVPAGHAGPGPRGADAAHALTAPGGPDRDRVLARVTPVEGRDPGAVLADTVLSRLLPDRVEGGGPGLDRTGSVPVEAAR